MREAAIKLAIAATRRGHKHTSMSIVQAPEATSRVHVAGARPRDCTTQQDQRSL